MERLRALAVLVLMAGILCVLAGIRLSFGEDAFTRTPGSANSMSGSYYNNRSFPPVSAGTGKKSVKPPKRSISQKESIRKKAPISAPEPKEAEPVATPPYAAPPGTKWERAKNGWILMKQD